MESAVARFANQIIEHAPWEGVNMREGLGTVLFVHLLDYSWDDPMHILAFEEARTNPHFAPWVVSEARGLALKGPSMLHGLVAAERQGEATGIASVMHSAFAQYMVWIVECELGRRGRLSVTA